MCSSTDCWMDLEYTWGGIVFNTENKEDADTCKGRDVS